MCRRPDIFGALRLMYVPVRMFSAPQISLSVCWNPDIFDTQIKVCVRVRTFCVWFADSTRSSSNNRTGGKVQVQTVGCGWKQDLHREMQQMQQTQQWFEAQRSAHFEIIPLQYLIWMEITRVLPNARLHLRSTSYRLSSLPPVSSGKFLAYLA